MVESVKVGSTWEPRGSFFSRLPSKLRYDLHITKAQILNVYSSTNFYLRALGPSPATGSWEATGMGSPALRCSPPPGYVPWSAARPAGATRLPGQVRLGCPRGRTFWGAAGAGSLGACWAGLSRVPGAAPRAGPPAGSRAAVYLRGAGPRSGGGVPGCAGTRPSRPPPCKELAKPSPR